ncbi:MAG: tetratricopeptide repeat protein [Candidatus Thorarchaeota archaeon]
MATNISKPESGKPSLFTGERSIAKKMVVIFSMILIGLALIIYRANYENWADGFISYNQILFGISLLLMIILVFIVLIDLKNILKHEIIGFIIFAVGALIIILFPARNKLGMSDFESGTIFFALGAIIIILGTVILMRTGGFVGVALLGLILNLGVSAFYMFGNTSAIQYNENTRLMIDLSIVFFIVSFLLLVYHDLKFFYLANLMRQHNNLRKKQKYNEALNFCDKALKVYPNFVTAWNNKGNVLFNLGKKNEAINCYKKALALNPNYSPAQSNLKLIQRS